MDYEVLKIENNRLILIDTETKDEWGHPTIMEFIMNDIPFKVGDKVTIMVVKRSLSE